MRVGRECWLAYGPANATWEGDLSERIVDWPVPPRVGVAMPAESSADWSRGAVWSALLEAWGIPFEPLTPDRPTDGFTTVLTADLLPGAPGLDDAEDLADAAFSILEREAAGGLVALWRWPDAKRAALVVDGDVDHPTGVDPECTRYVAPAIETARRAGFDRYGVFAAAANVEAEPSSFPAGADYYNHSFSHPYSHWNADPWESLDEAAMREEITKSDAIFRTHLGREDHRMFRLPHFQWEAWDRSASVLDELGYLAESSVGANRAITGGLPYHPAIRSWSDRPADASLLRTHPEPTRRRAFLQLPISSDPTDPGFPNGCCSYNTLGEGVRARTADPMQYQHVLDRVLGTAVARGSLAHVFIDPPDAGYGRLPGDTRDYAGAVEGWLRRALARDDLAVMSTAELTAWWLAREAAVRRITVRSSGGGISVGLDDPPLGSTIALFRPEDGWTYTPIGADPA
jgi:hypothetical protein